MQEFKTKGDRHNFVVDGRKLYLPGITFSDLTRAAEISALGEEGGEQFRQFITSRARPFWRRPLMGRLGFRALFEVYRAWVGVDVSGEAVGSQPSDIQTSSEPTSETSGTSD